MIYASSSRALSCALVALIITRLAAEAVPRAGTLELDPSKTLIEFSLPGALHTIHGAFKLERGIIRANPSTGFASGEIEVDAASGDSGSPARDRKMTESVLEAGKFPKIVFTPLNVNGAMDSNGEFRASLRRFMTVQGAQHEMAIKVEGRLAGRAADCDLPFLGPLRRLGTEGSESLPHGCEAGGHSRDCGRARGVGQRVSV